jgi:hypothetical protein
VINCKFVAAFLAVGSLFGYTTPPNYSYTPWIPDTLEIQPSVTGAYQTSQLATVGASVGTAFEPYAIELGADAFHSKKTSFSFEDFFLIGRYQWLNENIGDPVSLTFGAKCSLVSHIAVRERDLFHFGNFEAEVFASVGSGQFCSEFATDWTSRWWVTGGAGVANRHSPWFIGNGAYEYALCPSQRVRAFVDAIIGVGRQQKGIDVGVAGTWETFDYGSADLSYAYRVYARHVSRKVSTFTLCYYYPFGL